MADDRLRRINVYYPNPALAEWLIGPQAKGIVEEVTSEIFVAYRETLPVITGNLRRGAYMRVVPGGWGIHEDRWFGYVGNEALSYRKTRGKPYPRYIEYGKRGAPGQGQLRRAAGLIQGEIASVGVGRFVQPEGLHRDRAGRLRGPRGRFAGRPT